MVLLWPTHFAGMSSLKTKMSCNSVMEDYVRAKWSHLHKFGGQLKKNCQVKSFFNEAQMTNLFHRTKFSENWLKYVGGDSGTDRNGCSLY